MERLQKVIAQAGIASRRKAEQLIVDGQVKVNGQLVTQLGVKVSPKDRVEVAGVEIEKEEPSYYVLYKPRGIISSVKDDKGRKTVADFFNHIEERLFPVGRLDYNSSGLIIMTNDGEFANLLMHPRHEVPKTYVAKTTGIPTKADLNRLAKGIQLDDGLTAPARIRMLSSNVRGNSAIVQLTIHEGKNRQVRRMLEKIGCPVTKLKRESYGNLTLANLRVGEIRKLKPHEVKELRVIALSNS